MTLMKRARGMLAALLLGAILSVSYQAGLPSSASAQSVTIRFGTYVNEVDVRYEAFEHFARLVEERTNGEVKIELFCCGTLTPHSKGMDALLAGVADVWPLASVNVDPNRTACAAVTHWIPMNIDWERHTELDQEYNELLKPEMAEAGFVVIMSQNFSYDQEWFFREPTSSLEGLEGKLVRTGAPMVDHIIRKFGGTPVQIEAKEVYQSADRGVVDALNMGVATFSAFDLWEVMPHMLVVQTFYGNAMYAMAKKKFDSLKPEHQQVLLEVGRETAEWLKPRYEAWINEQIGAAVMKQNASAIALSPEERKRQIEFAADGWNEQIDEACGPELANKLRALWKKYEH